MTESDHGSFGLLSEIVTSNELSVFYFCCDSVPLAFCEDQRTGAVISGATLNVTWNVWSIGNLAPLGESSTFHGRHPSSAKGTLTVQVSSACH